MKRSGLYTCMASVMSTDSLSFLKYRFVELCSFDVLWIVWCRFRYYRSIDIVLVFNDIVSFSFSTKITKLKVTSLFLIVFTLATTIFLWATMASDSTSSHTRLPRIFYVLYSIFAKMNASKSIKIIELLIYRPPMCTDSFNKPPFEQVVGYISTLIGDYFY